MVIGVLYTVTVGAQVPLLQYLPADGLGNLTEAQQSKLSIAESIPGVNGSWLVEVAAITDLNPGESFSLSLPELACAPQVSTTFYEATSDSTWAYHAEIDEPAAEADSMCFDGSIHFDIHGAAVTGALALDGRRFEIHHLGGGVEVLVERDISTLGLRCGTDIDADSIGSAPGTLQQRTNGENCEQVRVVAVYTGAAQAVVPDIFGTIRLAINETNQVYRNSAIPATVANLRLVDMVAIEHVSVVNSEEDLGDLLGLQQVIDARIRTSADIVLAFTGLPGGQPIYDDEVVGLAGTLDLDPARALTLVLADQANIEFTAAHEISHLFGCRHQRANDNFGPIEHAWQFRFSWWRSIFSSAVSRDRNTAMWSNLTGQTIAHLSNPAVEFRGRDTGTDTDNNAQQVCNTACAVSTFFTAPPVQDQPLVARITGPTWACTCVDVSLGSLVTPAAVGPFAYSWRVSSDGVNYGPVVSTGAQYTLTLPCDPWMRTFAQLTVTDSRGQTSTTTHSVLTHEFDDLLCPRFGKEAPTSGAMTPTVTLFPNPANGTLFVTVAGASDDQSVPPTAEVFDQLGRKVLRAAISPTADGIYSLDLGAVKPGAYLLRWQDVPTPLRFIKTTAQ